MKRLLMVLLSFAVVIASSGMDCEGNAPAVVPSVNCFTTYFNETSQSGFSPPEGFVGPIPTPPNMILLRDEWFFPDDDVPTFAFASWETTNSLEESASIAAQLTGLRSSVEVNEEITLNSGQRGWLIEGRSLTFPDDLICVQSILVWNGRAHAVTCIGTSLNGTNDFRVLRGVARTLCAEGREF